MQKTIPLGHWIEEVYIADLPLLRKILAICQKSRKPSFWELMDPFVYLVYTSLTASRRLLRRLLASLNFTLDSEDLFCRYKRKKWFLWTMATAQAAENHGNEWGLTWFLRWGIYSSINCNLDPLTKLTNSSRSIQFKDISLWNIPKKWRRPPGTIISYAMKRGITFWVWWKVNKN